MTAQKITCPNTQLCNGRRPNFLHNPARDRLGLFFPVAGGRAVLSVFGPHQLVCGRYSQDRRWRGTDDPQRGAGNASNRIGPANQRADRSSLGAVRRLTNH